VHEVGDKFKWIYAGWHRMVTTCYRRCQKPIKRMKLHKTSVIEVLTTVLMTMQVFRDKAPCGLTVTNFSKERSAFACRVQQSKESHVQKPFQVHMRFKVRPMNVNGISSHTHCNTAISTAAVACHHRPCQTARLWHMVCRCDTWWNLKCFYASLNLFHFRNCFGTRTISSHNRFSHSGILRKNRNVVKHS
jgi:hypothetical protein